MNVAMACLVCACVIATLTKLLRKKVIQRNCSSRKFLQRFGSDSRIIFTTERASVETTITLAGAMYANSNNESLFKVTSFKVFAKKIFKLYSTAIANKKGVGGRWPFHRFRHFVAICVTFYTSIQ